jgi:hypothetical protein
MSLSRTDTHLGAAASALPLEQPPVRRVGLCLPGGSVEPVVPADLLLKALEGEEVERFRPLLPVGYEAGVDAYRAAVAGLTTRDLTTHYTEGLDFFRGEFAPRLATRLAELTGGVWDLSNHVAYAAGSDVDFMTHVVEAVSAREPVSLYPGDWFGFLVGTTHQERVRWDASGRGALACLCVPSVRNGHLTTEMLDFLRSSDACLLNLNLFPTLPPDERRAVAEALQGVLDRSVLSISFSRGFGLTASQLGVALVPRDHPYRNRYKTQWEWLTYFHNALAARAFLALEPDRLARVDAARRSYVLDWLATRGLPTIATGSYYVKSFLLEREVPEALRPLARDGLIRLCFKPPHA